MISFYSAFKTTTGKKTSFLLGLIGELPRIYARSCIGKGFLAQCESKVVRALQLAGEIDRQRCSALAKKICTFWKVSEVVQRSRRSKKPLRVGRRQICWLTRKIKTELILANQHSAKSSIAEISQ